MILESTYVHKCLYDYNESYDVFVDNLTIISVAQYD
jgi:hypothetical protein